MCVMEAVAYVAGEPHSDHPQCACPVVGAFLRSWNDAIQDDATRTALLAPLVTRLVGSRSTRAVEVVRSDLALDWLVRVQTPAWLDLTPALAPHAEALRRLAPVVGSGIAAAQPTLDAARDAARDAAGAAAGAAAWAAARAAAGAAAWDAAGAAAWAAARDAAWAAAGAALRPTVERLQLSALELVDRMLAVKEGVK